jgi:hypothetical protein
MNDLLAVVNRFLRGAQFEVRELSEGPFASIAQNENTLIFVVEVSSDLRSAVQATLSVLSNPFRSKSFGPKTMEMYAVFVCPEGVPEDEIEICERDIRVCRKLPIASTQDVHDRLLFLQPIEEVATGTVDSDELFWSELSRIVKPREIELLKALKSRPVTAEEIISRKTKE